MSLGTVCMAGFNSIEGVHTVCSTVALPPDGATRPHPVAQSFLRVRSTPEGAAIAVDNLPWDGPTDAQNMCTVGSRHVVLSKPGYYDENGDVVVQQGHWAKFERTLRPKP